MTGIVKWAGRKVGNTFKVDSAHPALSCHWLRRHMAHTRYMSAITKSRVTILHISRLNELLTGI